MLSALTSRAIKGEFYNRLSVATQADWVQATSMFFMSDQASETYEQLGLVSPMRVWDGERQAKLLNTLGNITIVNTDYESTLSVFKEEIRRDKTGQVDVRLNGQVQRATSFWAKLLTDLVETGKTALAQDGQAYFDTDHTEDENTTNQDNDLTTNITTANNPTAIEMQTAILKNISKIIGYKDNVNEPMNEDASEFTVMTPVNMMSAAQAALTSPLITDSSGSQTNIIVPNTGITIKLAVNARLIADDEFYTFRTDGHGTKSFIMQEEVPLTIDNLLEGSDEAFKNKRFLYGIEAVRGVGFGMWQHSVLHTFT